MKTISYSFCATFLFIFFITGVFAQSNKSKKLLAEAQKSFDQGAYQSTIKLCKNIIATESDYYDANLLLGKSYYKTYEFIAAKDQLLALENRSEYKNPEVSYMLGMTYKAMSNYESAKPLLEKYITIASDDNMVLKAKVELEGVNKAIENGKPVSDFHFANGGNQLNTKLGEISISTYPESNKIVVTRLTNDPKKSAENIKYKNTEVWMKINDGDEFDFLNTSGFESSGTFHKDLQFYIFTSCNTSGNDCQLLWSRNVDGIWQKAVPLPGSTFPKEFEYKDPFLSGDTLFFSSDRRGGIGGMDLWYSVRNKQGFWTIPTNLGEPINTPFDEVAPFAHVNGDFYFSSNGHPGYGLYDIFYVEGLNGIRTIHNLGVPFNSSRDDLHFKIYEGEGYLSSNRPDGLGDFDIYTFKEIVEEKVEPTTNNQVALDQAYSVLFSSKIYQLNPKFIGEGYHQYAKLNTAERQELQAKAANSYQELSDDNLKSIISDDKILIASLNKEDKFFVDRMAAAYFEDEKALTLNLSEEDAAHFNSLDNQEQRKLYRLSLVVINDLKGDFNPLNREVAKSNEEAPTPTFKTATAAATTSTALPEENDSKEEVEEDIDETTEAVTLEDQEEKDEEIEIVIPEEEVVLASNASTEDVNDENVSTIEENDEPEIIEVEETEEMVMEEQVSNAPASIETEQKDDTFTSYLGVNTSVSFYQNLPFADRKRVDRIMAIRLVNEKYTLYPGLSLQDRSYYQKLPQKEKDAINRLKLYFRSWSKNKELANLNENDIAYLSSLPLEKREVVARVIVRRGIGVDDENFVRFSNTDWNKYKSFDEEEVAMIKKVAKLLKDHQQVFDVALAYAGNDYTFNNNLAYQNNPQQPSQTLSASSDPEQMISGTQHTFESIYFDPGEYRLRKEALMALNELVEIYNENPEVTLALEAYSYENKSAPENIQLSTLRANSAKTYLVQKGVPDYKIKDQAHSVNLERNNQVSLQELSSRKLELNIANSANIFQSDYTTYLVQPGNTLYSLSKANDITVDELMALNGLNNTMLYANQPLRVKKTASLDQDFMIAPSDKLLYQPEMEIEAPVTSNEKIEDQTQQEEVTKEKVEEDRGESMMVIGVRENKSKPTRIHIVKKGEKLEDVAREFDTTVEVLMRDNDLKKPKVKRGQKLKIIQY